MSGSSNLLTERMSKCKGCRVPSLQQLVLSVGLTSRKGSAVNKHYRSRSHSFPQLLSTNTVRMRVVEIVIDGFKSYAVRTVISGWDESFNSITGLNGSGKSNILDAICFVLGITTMSTVRAQNIQVCFYVLSRHVLSLLLTAALLLGPNL